MEASGDSNWRKEVDEKLNRLHSLQFGVDLALENGDFSTAYILALRLHGFLDSHSLTDLDEALTRPIRREALCKLDSARHSLFPNSDRRAFEQADRVLGKVFERRVGVEKIKQSKYFQSLLHRYGINSSNEPVDQLVRKENSDRKTSKVMMQAKLTSLYGSKISKASNISLTNSLNSKNDISDDCMIVERDNSCQNQPGVPALSTKRPLTDISSPRYDCSKSLSSNEEAKSDVSGSAFVTARAKMEMDARQKRGLTGSPSGSASPQSDNINRGYGARYGFSRRGVRGNFIPPIKSNGGSTGTMSARVAGKGDDALDDSTRRCLEMLCGPDGELPEKLRNLEPRLIEHISNEIMDRDPNVRWDDIAGLEHAKKCVTEMVIWPLLRPDIFKGCRSPGRGLLLFGPPGTGKTMIGKAIAGEAKATFFYISASSLTSKWIGEGEKLVRALFGVATCRQPAVIFVDEIDSLLSQRKSEGEHESSRRLKTQFLIEMEGFDTGSEQILLIGATNRPQELDEAARRRLTKRLYIPLPSSEARAWIIRNLLKKDGLLKLSQDEIDTICNLTEGSDMKNLVKEASMGPLREALIQGIEITKLQKEDMRPVSVQDFENALPEVRPSVSLSELYIFEDWNKKFGSLSL
ncbi:hypothetical protein K2173_013847 [Erythroxylum novogranatense]|uniref:AAA+ ATPase domain-containing protein n=1 Tax=Erythroxylum novogranatense TaxID=1862640 RepID=A0AAV8SCH9_9ROSI|nr:hypothetical protein K2173_013847 [Erythroxylum novogranatense]